MEKTSGTESNKTFQQKVWIVAGIVAFTVILLWILKVTFNVLLLILVGALIAIYFRGLANLICRKTKLKSAICLVISIVGTLLLIVGLFWLIGAKVQQQVNQLSETLPTTIENAKAQISKIPIGRQIVEKASSPESMRKAQALAGRLFQSTFGVFGDLYIVLILGIFFTISPQLYKKGMVRLVPKKGQKKADEVLDITEDHLRKWLKGQIFAMFVVFVLTAIGLVIMRMPMWLVLALIAGILNFVPNFGPLIAMIPAVLIGLLQSPATALFVAGLYILVQVLESSLVTPTVQKKLLNTPPALIILAQLFMAPLSGGWGLVLAMPLLVIIIVLVQELYIKRQEASG